MGRGGNVGERKPARSASSGTKPKRPEPARRKAAAKPATEPRFYYKGNRLKQLRAFCAVARLGTVSRAADALFLSQPSVSLQLSALEKEIGVGLIDRVGRRVQLTREGLMLYELARPMLEQFDTLERDFRTKVTGLDNRELNIAAGASTIQYLLPSLVQSYRARHPEVRLQLQNVTGRDGLALLRSDEVDFAVGSMLEVPTDLAYEPVYSFDPMLITSLDHPLAQAADVKLEDLSPYGLILPPKRLTTYRLVDLIFQQRKVPYQVAIEVGGWELIKQYVAMGLGISIVTGICLQPGDRVASHNLRRYFPPRSYGVVMRKGKYLSPQARAFVDLIKPGLFASHSER